MKKLLLCASIFLYCPLLVGQGYVTVVADAKLTAAVLANHAVTMGAFMPMAGATERIREHQEDIAMKALVIRTITGQTYKSLSEVSALITEGENREALRELVKEIAEYQAEMAGYAKDNPALAAVAIQAGSAMAFRAAALMGYALESALAGGDENLINSRQRMEIIRKAIKELRCIRAMAFEACRRMKTACRARTAALTHPFKLPYPEKDKTLVTNLLNNL